MPRITVVLPTWNRAHTLKASMTSVLQQSLADFEFIVIDDGSTDGTEAVVRANADPRLRYEKLAANGGVSRARNRGIELARAEWIAFQDSDDVWLPDKLERQLAAATADTVLVVTRDRVINDAALSYATSAHGAVVDLTRESALRLPPAATWLARRDALRAENGFDPMLDCYEDWELGLRLAARGTVVLVNAPLVERTKTHGSLYSDEASRLRNLRLIVERHRATLERDPRAWAYYANALGQMSMQDGAPAEARRWFREAVRARPLAPRGWANFVMSLGGPALFSRYVRLARSMRGTLARLQA